MTNIYRALTMDRPVDNFFTCMNSFNTNDNPTRWVLLLSPFHRCGHGSQEMGWAVGGRASCVLLGTLFKGFALAAVQICSTGSFTITDFRGFLKEDDKQVSRCSGRN